MVPINEKHAVVMMLFKTKARAWFLFELYKPCSSSCHDEIITQGVYFYYGKWCSSFCHAFIRMAGALSLLFLKENHGHLIGQMFYQQLEHGPICVLEIHVPLVGMILQQQW